MPNAFRRNYSLRSIGSTKRDKVEAYLASQLEHHPMADERVQERLAEYQIHDPKVDLSDERQTSHAIYWYNLHLVFVMRDREMHLAHGELSAMREMIRGAAKSKGHLLSRAAILPDMMRWLWRDHQFSSDPKDAVERSFDVPKKSEEKQ
jgi:REP element-mobilizing transposase RayT